MEWGVNAAAKRRVVDFVWATSNTLARVNWSASNSVKSNLREGASWNVNKRKGIEMYFFYNV